MFSITKKEAVSSSGGDDGRWLLKQVLDAQQHDEEVVSYPLLERYAHALVDVCSGLDDTIVWPAGEAAERLAGAAVLVSAGRVRVRGWSRDLQGERVLVLAVTGVTPLSLLQAAQTAERMGAREVHGCGVRVAGMGSELPEVLRSYRELAVDTEEPSSFQQMDYALPY